MASLYDTSIPPFIRGLTNLKGLLEKGRAYAAEQGWEESELTQARLVEDMQPLTYQVQRVSDTAKGLAVRVGQAENEAFPDEEVTLDDLVARIDRTIAFLQNVPAAGFDGRDDAEVVLKTPNREITFTGTSYVLGFAVPNFYFHITAAYAILRMKGVPVGKMDYLGAQ
ncbi:MAG: DUF1993 domain-containing protein [Croceibacterium sp.]